MKINYERTVPINPTLSEIRPGDLFRPTNADDIYIRTPAYASDDFVCDKEQPLKKIFDDVQRCYATGESLDCEALIFCVHLETGKLVLLDCDLHVEKLVGELLIKQR